MTVPPNYGRRLVNYLHDAARLRRWPEFEYARRQMFELWTYGFLSEDYIVPFRDLWFEPAVFFKERQRLLEQAARGIGPDLLPKADPSHALHAWRIDWFVGVWSPRPGGSVEEFRAWQEQQATELLRSLFPGPQPRMTKTGAGVTAPKRERRANPHAITQAQFANVYGAVAFAQYIGFPLNMHVSVTWSTLGLERDEDIRAAHLRLIEAMRKFVVETLQLPQHHFWVLERTKKRGLHSHVMVHVPAANRIDLEKMLARAVETITGTIPVKTPETKTVFVRPLRTFKEQWHVFNYLMKGVYRDEASLSRRERERYREFLKSLTETPCFEGSITGQRVRVSRALDSEARRRAAFVDFWAQGRRDPRGLYVDYVHEAEIERLLNTMDV